MTHISGDRPAWPYPRVSAHRGGGALAPENTIAALRFGAAAGFRGVEFDAMLSADGVPVLMHDAQFGRTVKGAGDVAAHTAQELMALDAGSWFDARYAGEPVPTLAQAMDFCHRHGVWMNIEIKPSSPRVAARTGEVVASEVAQFCSALKSSPVPVPLLSSFSRDALAAARQVAPQLARGLLVREIPPDWRERLEALGARALHAGVGPLTRAQVQAVRQAGYGLFCYTVNDVARASEILDWGVDGFCTDRLDLIGAGFAGSIAGGPG